MKRKLIGVLLGIVMVFTLIGCDNAEEPVEDITTNPVEEDVDEPETEENIGEDEDVEEDLEDEVAPEKKEKEVTLYFANKEYIETGDEDLEKLIEEKRSVEYEGEGLEEAIFEELKKGPEKLESETVIRENINILDIEVSGATAFVNFDGENLSGGSMEEIFIIDQITNTLFELDYIDKVQFLINGEKAESLMGHMDISEPISRE